MKDPKNAPQPESAPAVATTETGSGSREVNGVLPPTAGEERTRPRKTSPPPALDPLSLESHPRQDARLRSAGCRDGIAAVGYLS